MRRFLLSPLFIFLSLATSPLRAATPFNYSNDEIAQSIRVVRVSDGKILFDQQGALALVPASVSKLVASAAILSSLGPNYRFATRFYYSGTFKNGTISGDLIAVGDGDPLLLSEDLWQIANELKQRGLRSIKGALVVDNSLFSSQGEEHSGRNASSTSAHSYDAPVTAFGVNFNTLTLAISPGSAPAARAQISLDPLPQPLVSIENKLTTGKAGSKESISVVRLARAQGGNTLRVSGEIPLDAPARRIYRSVQNPEITAGEYLRAFLLDQGVKITGPTREGILPKNATLLSTHTGRELSQIVRSLHFYSNNFIADVLVNRLGASLPTSAGDTWQGGLAQINGFLRNEMKWDGAYNFSSGSGLSNENRLSAEKLTSLLSSLTSQWRFFPEFLASLPLAGESGSLQRRFLKGPGAALKGSVRAKTGTFVDPMVVSSLAGYMMHPTQHLIAFAIIQNGITGKSQPALATLHNNEERGLAEILEIL
jgi:D-alanyl-D-alanine carboxypeptidase/D-alanyl-D-alanine-endopeptidase (penicillin-binding protein 4)